MRGARRALFPGALSPTEILAAWSAGASAVKLFPASAVGPGYLAQVAGPFPDIPMVPTGGVSADTAGEWIAAGAVALGRAAGHRRRRIRRGGRSRPADPGGIEGAIDGAERGQRS